MKRGRKPIPEETRAKIIHCVIAKKMSYEATARSCRCGVSTVCRYVRRYRRENIV